MIVKICDYSYNVVHRQTVKICDYSYSVVHRQTVK